MSGNRRTSYAAVQREIEREAARAQRAHQSAVRDAERDRIANRVEQAQRATDAVEARVQELSTVLVRGLARSADPDLDGRLERIRTADVDLGADAEPIPPPRWDDFAPPSPSWLGRVFRSRRHDAQVQEGEARFAGAQAHHAQEESDRQRRVRAGRQAHATAIEQAERDTREWQAGVTGRERPHVERYLSEVLGNLPLPQSFPRKADVTFDPGGDHAVVRIELPGRDVVPPERSFQYVRPPRDETVTKPRSERERAQLYRTVVAEVALLALRDLFQADPHLRQISLNGHVWTTNRATGSREYPCLVSVIVERPEFTELTLDQVSPADCLKHLGALVSPHPYEVEAVRPLIDFDRSRYAFTEGIDVAAGLDSRDDLMTLTPTEFEHLVRQLFEALPGMQGWTTRASGDNGVDAVIFNDTPITGGLTVVQAKRYKSSVGVAHVRELAGAMEDKKAGRGVLVTTSTFTKGAVELAERLQRIQLIDRHHLVQLLKETLDKDVLIGDGSRPAL